MKWYEHLACGLSPVLFMIGSLLLIGGSPPILGWFCSFAAYTLNAKIFTKNISSIEKYLCSILVGFGAHIVAYLLYIISIFIFPSVY